MYKETEFAEVIRDEDGRVGSCVSVQTGEQAFLHVVDTVLCMDKTMASDYLWSCIWQKNK